MEVFGGVASVVYLVLFISGSKEQVVLLYVWKKSNNVFIQFDIVV